jgi:methionine biosynthesis protein MetW
MRFDLQVIGSWVEPGAKVLDLGCGSGSLLRYLREERGAVCTGIERDQSKVVAGIERGLTVVHGDMNEEVLDYPDHAFDYVILSQALMQVMQAEKLLHEMLRVGRMGVVSFPNFSHWRHRLQMLFTGRAPVSRELPYEWYDTPNIRVITLRDFKRFCHRLDMPILKECAICTHHHAEKGKIVHFKPELFATYGIYLLGQPATKTKD